MYLKNIYYKHLGIEMCHNMKSKNKIKTVISKLKKIIYTINQLCEIIKYKNIRTIYLTFFEFLITYGIISWGEVCGNALTQLQKCHNTIIKVASKKDWRYLTKKLFEEFNIFNTDIFLKTYTIYLKKH